MRNLFILLISLAVVFQLVESDEEIENCKIHYHAGCGYHYETFFNINEIRSGNNFEYAGNMKLYISGSQDAHILLAPVSHPAIGTDHYEIDVGVNWNKATEIRRRKYTGDFLVMNSTHTKNILSVNEKTPIRVKVRHDGTIEVSFPGTNFATVTAKDDCPILVNYISFTSYLTETNFIFQCPSSDNRITPCAN